MNNFVFSHQPGARERHLQRKYNNNLFSAEQRDISPNQLESAQYMDEQDNLSFDSLLHSLIEKIANMEQNVSSEMILNYKEQMDKLYSDCSCLAGDQLQNKKIIIQLINLLMKAVWKGASGDMQAMENLKEEEIAREQHIDLLEIPLVADLLETQSQITEEELIPVLLSEKDKNLKAVMGLFMPEQQQQIYQDAVSHMQKLSDIEESHPGWKKLEVIKSCSHDSNSRLIN
ncbi:MAG: hypothetical protein QM504_03945 [Pseudomonadota bacterium]